MASKANKLSQYGYYITRVVNNNENRESTIPSRYTAPIELKVGCILGRNVSNFSRDLYPNRLDIGIVRTADGVSRECFEVLEIIPAGVRILVVPYTKNRMEFVVKGVRISAIPGAKQLLSSGDIVIFDAFGKPPIYTFSIKSAWDVQGQRHLVQRQTRPITANPPPLLPPMKKKKKKLPFFGKVLKRKQKGKEKKEEINPSTTNIPAVAVVSREVSLNKNWAQSQNEDDSSSYSSDSPYLSNEEDFSFEDSSSYSGSTSSSSQGADLPAKDGNYEVTIPLDRTSYLNSTNLEYLENKHLQRQQLQQQHIQRQFEQEREQQKRLKQDYHDEKNYDDDIKMNDVSDDIDSPGLFDIDVRGADDILASIKKYHLNNPTKSYLSETNTLTTPAHHPKPSTTQTNQIKKTGTKPSNITTTTTTNRTHEQVTSKKPITPVSSKTSSPQSASNSVQTLDIISRRIGVNRRKYQEKKSKSFSKLDETKRSEQKNVKTFKRDTTEGKRNHYRTAQEGYYSDTHDKYETSSVTSESTKYQYENPNHDKTQEMSIVSVSVKSDIQSKGELTDFAVAGNEGKSYYHDNKSNNNYDEDNTDENSFASKTSEYDYDDVSVSSIETRDTITVVPQDYSPTLTSKYEIKQDKDKNENENHAATQPQSILPALNVHDPKKNDNVTTINDNHIDNHNKNTFDTKKKMTVDNDEFEENMEDDSYEALLVSSATISEQPKKLDRPDKKLKLLSNLESTQENKVVREKEQGSKSINTQLQIPTLKPTPIAAPIELNVDENGYIVHDEYQEQEKYNSERKTKLFTTTTTIDRTSNITEKGDTLMSLNVNMNDGMVHTIVDSSFGSEETKNSIDTSNKILGDTTFVHDNKSNLIPMITPESTKEGGQAINAEIVEMQNAHLDYIQPKAQEEPNEQEEETYLRGISNELKNEMFDLVPDEDQTDDMLVTLSDTQTLDMSDLVSNEDTSANFESSIATHFSVTSVPQYHLSQSADDSHSINVKGAPQDTKLPDDIEGLYEKVVRGNNIIDIHEAASFETSKKPNQDEENRNALTDNKQQNSSLNKRDHIMKENKITMESEEHLSSSSSSHYYNSEGATAGSDESLSDLSESVILNFSSLLEGNIQEYSDDFDLGLSFGRDSPLNRNEREAITSNSNEDEEEEEWESTDSSPEDIEISQTSKMNKTGQRPQFMRKRSKKGHFEFLDQIYMGDDDDVSIVSSLCATEAPHDEASIKTDEGHEERDLTNQDLLKDEEVPKEQTIKRVQGVKIKMRASARTEMQLLDDSLESDLPQKSSLSRVMEPQLKGVETKLQSMEEPLQSRETEKPIDEFITAVTDNFNIVTEKFANLFSFTEEKSYYAPPPKKGKKQRLSSLTNSKNNSYRTEISRNSNSSSKASAESESTTGTLRRAPLANCAFCNLTEDLKNQYQSRIAPDFRSIQFE